MDREIAEKILEIAEHEMARDGGITFELSQTVKDAVDKIGRNYLDYFIVDGVNLIFLSARWRYHYLGDETGQGSPPNIT